MKYLIILFILSNAYAEDAEKSKAGNPTYNFNFYHDKDDSEEVVENDDEDEEDLEDESDEEEGTADIDMSIPKDNILNQKHTFRLKAFARYQNNNFDRSEKDDEFHFLGSDTVEDYTYSVNNERFAGAIVHVKDVKFYLGAGQASLNIEPSDAIETNTGGLFGNDPRTTPRLTFKDTLNGYMFGAEYDPEETYANGIGFLAGVTRAQYEKSRIDNPGVGAYDLKLETTNIYFGMKFQSKRVSANLLGGYAFSELEIDERYEINNRDFEDSIEQLETTGWTLGLQVDFQLI
jgi:hypothetical protein